MHAGVPSPSFCAAVARIFSVFRLRIRMLNRRFPISLTSNLNCPRDLVEHLDLEVFESVAGGCATAPFLPFLHRWVDPRFLGSLAPGALVSWSHGRSPSSWGAMPRDGQSRRSIRHRAPVRGWSGPSPCWAVPVSASGAPGRQSPSASSSRHS